MHWFSQHRLRYKTISLTTCCFSSPGMSDSCPEDAICIFNTTNSALQQSLYQEVILPVAVSELGCFSDRKILTKSLKFPLFGYKTDWTTAIWWALFVQKIEESEISTIPCRNFFSPLQLEHLCLLLQVYTWKIVYCCNLSLFHTSYCLHCPWSGFQTCLFSYPGDNHWQW